MTNTTSVASFARRLFVALSALLVTMALSTAAFALGSIKPEKNALTEEEGRWKLKLTIDYGSMPDINFIPMDFIFEQTVLYERSLTDESGDKPVLTKKQLQNQKPISEGMNVGFSDGSGKMFKVTKFDFVIRRDRGFEAGEYTLTVKRADDGQQIGQKMKLVLNGDNPVINRKSITFSDDPKAKEDPSKVKSKADPTAYNAEKGDGSSSGDGDSSGSGSSDGSAAEPPPAVEPKQGGCGCRVVGEQPTDVGAPAGLALFAIVGAALYRRRGRSERAVS
ncbi:MAG: hypothetical protein HOW73_01670 [Polyangiaceae bacterium]|nr:hypothetical protein [Polyangiaceae bacterium]